MKVWGNISSAIKSLFVKLAIKLEPLYKPLLVFMALWAISGVLVLSCVMIWGLVLIVVSLAWVVVAMITAWNQERGA